MRTKTTPHMKAVNQMAVCWLGWYFRITIGCGTGRSLARINNGDAGERGATGGGSFSTRKNITGVCLYPQNALLCFFVCFPLPLAVHCRALPCLSCQPRVSWAGRTGDTMHGEAAMFLYVVANRADRVCAHTREPVACRTNRWGVGEGRAIKNGSSTGATPTIKPKRCGCGKPSGVRMHGRRSPTHGVSYWRSIRPSIRFMDRHRQQL